MFDRREKDFSDIDMGKEWSILSLGNVGDSTHHEEQRQRRVGDVGMPTMPTSQRRHLVDI